MVRTCTGEVCVRSSSRSPFSFGWKKKVSCASRAGCSDGKVEPCEIVVVGLDVRPFGDRKAHIGEDHHQLFPDAADRVDAAFGGRVGPDGEGDVHAIGGELFGEGCGFERAFARFEGCGDLVLDGIDGGAEALARLGGHGAKLFHKLGDFALLTECGDAYGVKRGQISSRLHATKQALRKRIEIV